MLSYIEMDSDVLDRCRNDVTREIPSVPFGLISRWMFVK